ncbi:DUF1877 family protein [Streptomyces asoensis]|uniref:DUF1877 family protein n=1 Tax=Streptomyces asoensis TaxID=249586 RepID=UPI00340BAF4E
MSIHMHMRAVAESEIRDDHTWLTAFMYEAWENHPAEYAAGIAESIAKVFDSVNDLYAASETLDPDVGELWLLPIYGGRPAAHSAGADTSDPPLMILEPHEVSRTADFLARVSFDELWNAAGARLGGQGQDGEEMRQELLDHHSELREFYARAAAAGHAVVRVVWA